jgi:hypothetical protein
MFRFALLLVLYSCKLLSQEAKVVNDKECFWDSSRNVFISKVDNRLCDGNYLEKSRIYLMIDPKDSLLVSEHTDLKSFKSGKLQYTMTFNKEGNRFSVNKEKDIYSNQLNNKLHDTIFEYNSNFEVVGKTPIHDEKYHGTVEKLYDNLSTHENYHNGIKDGVSYDISTTDTHKNLLSIETFHCNRKEGLYANFDSRNNLLHELELSIDSANYLSKPIVELSLNYFTDNKIKEATLKIKSMNKIIKFVYSSDGVLMETIESKYY